MSAQNVLPLIVSGVPLSIVGISDLSKGNISQGIPKMITGWIASSIGAQLIDGDDWLAKQTVAASIFGGSVLSVLKGALTLFRGLQSRTISQIITGTKETICGITLSYVSTQFDSILLVYAIAALYLSSSLSKKGFQHINEGSYQKGTYQLLLGIFGATALIYCIHSECSNKEIISFTMPEMPQNLRNFLDDHHREIEELQKSPPNIIGKWKLLGSGVSKKAFFHPDCDYLIKVPHLPNGSFWSSPRALFAGNDADKHHRNLVKAHELVLTHSLEKLHIPNSYLYHTLQGSLVIEQKLHTISYKQIPNSLAKRRAEDQLRQLLNLGQFCDINVSKDHNAEFLSNNLNPKIGIYDFDCIKKSSNVIDDRTIGIIMTGGSNAVGILATKVSHHVLGKIATIAVLTSGLATGYIVATKELSIRDWTDEDKLRPIAITTMGGALGSLAIAFSITALSKLFSTINLLARISQKQ